MCSLFQNECERVKAKFLSTVRRASAGQQRSALRTSCATNAGLLSLPTILSSLDAISSRQTSISCSSFTSSRHRSSAPLWRRHCLVCRLRISTCRSLRVQHRRVSFSLTRPAVGRPQLLMLVHSYHQVDDVRTGGIDYLCIVLLCQMKCCLQAKSLQILMSCCWNTRNCP